MLNRLERDAQVGNLSIEQALARIDQSRAAAAAAGAALGPTGQTDASAARAQQSLNSGLGQLSRFVPGFPRKVDRGQIAASGSWDIDFAGGLLRRREAARAGLAEAEAGELAARLAVSAEIADAYFTWRGALVEVEARRRLAAALVGQSRIMDARVRVGAASASDGERARAAAAQAAAVPALLDAVAAAQRNRIAVLLGRSPSLPLDLPSDRPMRFDAPDPAADLPVDVIRRRPDVAASEARLVSANARIGAALAEYYPRISLSGLLGVDSNGFGNLLSGDSVVAQSAVGLRWRLFDFARIDAEVAGARGATREALAAYRESVLRAAEDVETAFLQLAGAREQAARLETERERLAAVSASAERAYAVGEISRDQRLDADRSLDDADARLAAARRDRARTIVAAARALAPPSLVDHPPAEESRP